MQQNSDFNILKKIFTHFRKFIIRGAIALIPLGLTLLILRIIYLAIDRRIIGYVDNYLGFSIPGLGILLLLVLLYLVGLVTSNVLGRHILNLLEKMINRIPLIKTTYQVGKQLSTTLSLPERQVFKKAVLVDYLKPGIWTIGFVTGYIIDKANDNMKLLKVFVPTPPNPTTGTMVLVKESMVRDPGWTIEEAMRTVISGGIIGPKEIEEPKKKIDS